MPPRAWMFTQWGLCLLPFSPLLGVLGFFGATIGVLAQGVRSLQQDRLNGVLVALSVWLILLSSLAEYPAESFLGLANFLPCFFLFAIFSRLIRSIEQLRQIAWILVLGSIPVVLIGLGQLFWGWGGHLQVLWIVIHWTIDPGGTPPDRMASIFSYANVLASYLVTTLILALGLGVEAWLTWRGIIRNPQSAFHFLPFAIRNSQSAFLILLPAIVLNALGLILTDSRNAWGILVLAGLAFALYLGWRWLVVGVVTLAGVVAWSAFGSVGRDALRQVVPGFIWMRLTDQLYPDRPIASLRITQWQFCWSLMEERPWTGWGLRNFTPLYEAKMDFWLGHPHNLPLMLLAETGIPATMVLVGVVAWVMGKGVWVWRSLPLEAGSERLWLFTYLVAFSACTLFHFLDVTFFDLRINVLNWLLLASVWGVVQSRSETEAL